jgi:hypothetical protein
MSSALQEKLVSAAMLVQLEVHSFNCDKIVLDIYLEIQMHVNGEGFYIYEKGNRVDFSISVRDENGRPIEGDLVLLGDGVTLWGTCFHHQGNWADDHQAYAELAAVALNIARVH